MVFKSFNLSLVIRLVIFALSIAGLTMGLIHSEWIISIPLMLVLLISFSELIYFMNTINRKVAYFFDSVYNDDTTLHYSEHTRTRSLRALHESLNRLNRHIAEIKLKNEYNVRFFNEMLKYSATGLMAVDEKGYIEQINNAALGLIGLPHISHIDLLQQKNAGLYNLLTQITPGKGRTIKLLHDTELRHLSVKMTMLSFGEKKYRLYSVYDIKAELEENELDSWQKLIRVITHEIMNSIAPITSLSNTLSRIFVRDKAPIPADEVTQTHISNIVHGLEVIEETGQGLMRFVENYRRFTKIPQPDFKPIDIRHWLNALQVLMKNRLEEENIQLRIRITGAQKEFIGDAKLLNQVMINILTNAIEALKNTHDKAIVISVFGHEPEKLRITVTDNGSGIAQDDIEKVFVPFYTTKENGSGIGLSLSRKIMRLHKGSISAFSTPGKQTTFALEF
jgi:nitrogen fixation/metabolism regulation signal transduction histidine kinase